LGLGLIDKDGQPVSSKPINEDECQCKNDEQNIFAFKIDHKLSILEKLYDKFIFSRKNKFY